MAVTITDRRTIYDEADSTTGWTPGSFGTTTTDIAESTAAVAESFAISSGEVYFTGSAIDLSDTLVYVYAFNNALLNAWDSSPPPIALTLGDGVDLISFDMAGGDRRVFNHLEGGLDLTNIVDIGAHFDTQSKALGGGYNVAVDIIRYGNLGIRLTAGGSGTEGSFSEIAVADRGTGNQQAHGILRAYTTIAYGVQGPLTFGDSGTSTASWFEDTGVVVVFEDRNISDDKYFFNVEGHVTPTNSFILTSSTIATAGPGVTMDFSGGNINTLTFTNVVFSALGRSITFSANADASGHNVTNCTFDGAGQIDAADVNFVNNIVTNSVATTSALVAGDGDMSGLTMSGYEGTADTSALIYDQAANPSGNLDDSTFTMGTALTHAIEFGLLSSLTLNLDNITFTGYNASDAQNDSALHFKRTSGTVTVNLSGMTEPSFKTDGATIVFVQSVTLTVTVTDQAGVAIANPRVSIREQADNSEESQGEASAGGVYTDASYAYTADLAVFVRVRKSTSGTRYFPAVVPATILDTGLALSVTLIEDPIA